MEDNVVKSRLDVSNRLKRLFSRFLQLSRERSGNLVVGFAILLLALLWYFGALGKEIGIFVLQSCRTRHIAV